ncbi:MAG: hypothetical protein ACKVJE_01615 [Pseudomonadales bacterium]
MLSMFKFRPLIDLSSADWIYDTFEWAMQSFDNEEFFQRSLLVQPTNEFFPGNVDSVHAKAENIFKHTLAYAGLAHWPFQLQPPELFENLPAHQIELTRLERNSTVSMLPVVYQHPLTLSYNPQQTLKPEDLSSSFAHVIAQHMLLQSHQLPPGGVDYLTEGSEVLAVFMGFGVMLANSAYTFRGGCGSCYNAQANRQASLSENEIVFALALYCRLKGIADSQAVACLKKHLKSNYKQACKQLDKRPDRLARLMEYKREVS